MKKKLIIASIALFMASVNQAYCQPWVYSSTGTTSGSGDIQTNNATNIWLGNAKFTPSVNNVGIAKLNFNAGTYTEIYSNGNNLYNPSMFLFNTNSSIYTGDILFRTWNTDRFKIRYNGRIEIGSGIGLQTLDFKTDNYTEIYSGTYGSSMFMGTANQYLDGGMLFKAYNNLNRDQNVRAYAFLTNNFSNDNSTTGGDERAHLTIRKNGKVVVGDVLNYHSINDNSKVPDGYKLIVQDGILTEKVKIATIFGGQWSDFVFANDYKLRPLDEVEEYINKNKHLPEIPSAQEVEKEGLDLAQMDAKLLQKVEELTLYMIDMKKENEQLKKRLSELERGR